MIILLFLTYDDRVFEPKRYDNPKEWCDMKTCSWG